MQLTVLSSESSGNCYLFQSSNEVLIIDSGIRLSAVKTALNFDLSNVVGCLVDHGHLDHARYLNDYMKAGINVYTSKDTINHLGLTGHRLHPIIAQELFTVGEFKIIPFDVPHNLPCLGFLVVHKECGKLLFVTDASHVPNKFVGLNTIMVEANYDDPLLTNERAVGKHMSIDTCLAFLKANDMRTVRNIILLHLSSSNSDARQFRQSVQAVAPNASVHIADRGLTIPLSIHPF